MDKALKRRIRRLWRDRLLMSFGAIAFLGLSMLQLQAVLRHRPSGAGVVLELTSLLEELNEVYSSDSEKALVVSKIQRTAQNADLKVTVSWTQALFFDLTEAHPEPDPPYKAWIRAYDMADDLGMSRQLNLAVSHGVPEIQILRSVVDVELEQAHGLQLQQGKDLERLRSAEPGRARAFLHAGVLLGLSVFGLLVLLVLLARQKGSYTLPSAVHLIAFLPEECAAELGILHRRMKKTKASPWEIRLRLLEEFLTLLWVFYIQVQLENLILPSDDREIDD